MTLNTKIAILHELKALLNPNENEETKTTWDTIRDLAQNKFTDKTKTGLTEEAIKEANDNNLDVNEYRKLLVLLSNTSNSRLQDNIKKTYGNLEIRVDELLEDTHANINKLALFYGRNKSDMDMFKLLLCNPGEIIEEGNLKRVTTFVHALFENKVTKDDIISFFDKLNEIGLSNPELVQNYLGLSDQDGKSITAILKYRSLDLKYMNIFDDIKSRFPELYPVQRVNIINNVNTHTGSIHGSVDKSLATLALIYDVERVSVNDGARSVTVNRDDKWSKSINGDIDALEVKLKDIVKDDRSVEDFITPTLAPREYKQRAIKKFKFQAEAALRMVEGLKGVRYGNHYTVYSQEKVSCGLSPKEIVAIAYNSLSHRTLWNNPDQELQQFMNFIENLYIAKRGYNIDKNSENEWDDDRFRGEPDDNKCAGGTVNQIAYGLVDHHHVEIKIINSDTMAAPLISKLKSGILADICRDEDNKKSILNWVDGGLLDIGVANEILERLRSDDDFKEEFSLDEIRSIAPQVLNKLNESQLKDIKKLLIKEVNYQDSDDQLNSLDIYKFDFDPDKGYVLALEKLYKNNKDKFTEKLKQNLRGNITDRNIGSIESNKFNVILGLLFSSSNKEMIEEVKRVFLEHIGNFNQEAKDQYLIGMVEVDNTAVLNLLIKSGADINAKDNRLGHDERTALMTAVLNNNVKAIELLIQYGADVNVTDKYGKTPLMRAAHKLELVKLLLENGADINVADKFGKTTLMFAAESSYNMEAMKLLLEKGANVNAVDQYGYTALIVAVTSNNLEAIKFLLENGANINAVEKNESTALMFAAIANRVKAIKILLENRANVNVVDKNGNTAFMLAVKSNNLEAIKFLLKSGADINALDKNGYTPLIIAVRNHNLELVKFLIENGADVSYAISKRPDLEGKIIKLIPESHMDLFKEDISNYYAQEIVKKIKHRAGWLWDDAKSWKEVENIVKNLREEDRVETIIKAANEINNTSRRSMLIGLLNEKERDSVMSSIKPTWLEAATNTLNAIHGYSSTDGSKKRFTEAVKHDVFTDLVSGSVDEQSHTNRLNDKRSKKRSSSNNIG